MNKKYEFTGETKEFYGRILKRIRAKISFGNIISGEIGGWIEKEANLSHNGNAWVYDNAKVYDNAWVYGNARVYDNAKVYGNAWVSDNARVYDNAKVYGNAKVYDNAWVSDNAWVYGNAKVYDNAWVSDDAEVIKTRHIISFSRVGSRNDTLTAFRTKTGFSIKVGCFLGDLKLFLEKVEETHGENKYAQEYRAIAEVIKIRFSEEE